MNQQPPTSPLDQEERALAQRLARLGPQGEPSPALDAKVLAAAHAAANAAASTAAANARRRRTRWSLPLGVAASLVLALGVAWQLRPLPGADPAAGTATADMATAEVPTDATTEAPAPAVAQEIRQLAPPPPVAAPEPAPVATTRRVAVPASAPAAASANAPAAPPAPAPPPPEQPAVVFDRPAPMDATQAAAPAATPAKAARATVQTAAEGAARMSEADADAVADAPEADVPPATVASPQVREAWLARIRALVADGQLDEARASLEEFQRRYPHFALPEDLRDLPAR